VIPGKVYTPQDILQLFRRGRWFIAGGAILGTAAAIGVAMSLPNQYQSETVVLVIPQRVPENYVQNTVTTRINDRIQSISEQILSRSRLEPIIKEFNLYEKERATMPMDEVIALMREKAKTRVVRGDAFTVSYIGEDPVTVQKVTARLSSLFTEENMRDREVIAESTNQFLQTQLDEARQQLTASEQQVQEFRKKYAGELPDQAQSNLSAIQTAESQIQTLTESINRDRDRRLLLERQLADLQAPEAPPPPPVAGPVPANTPQTPEQALESAEANLRSLLTKLTPAHPDVVQARLTVERLRKDVAAQRPTQTTPDAPAPTPRVTAAEQARRSRITALSAEMDGLTRQLEQKIADEVRLRDTVVTYRRRLEAAPVRQSELTALTRDYDTLQRQYEGLLKKFEDSKVAANMERRQIGEQFRVLDPARVPETPIAPNRKLIAALGLVGGIVIGVALVGFREFLDRTLRTVQDAETALQLPVLAVLSVVDGPATKRRFWQRARA